MRNPGVLVGKHRNGLEFRSTVDWPLDKELAWFVGIACFIPLNYHPCRGYRSSLVANRTELN